MLWVEPGEDRTGPVATVAPVLPLGREYAFAVPDDLAVRLRPGHRVRVPVGRKGRLVTAFCLDIEQGRWSHTLKPIASLVDPVSYLDSRMLELGRWIARHYACPVGRTLNALVPAAVHKQRGFRTHRQARLQVPVEEIARDHPRLGPGQRRLLEHLTGEVAAVEVGRLLSATGVSAATLRQVTKRGWVEITTQRLAEPAPVFDLPRKEPAFELNEEQRAAFESITAMIDQGRFRVGLLFGVSGCGKTEVYIRAMRRVLAAGQQVMLLVPEIALTTQLVGRLACRFGDVAVIHSGLSEVQRSLTWNEIRTGDKRVVIGTRSAIFAPCQELGLIVVDEEQETSYKNLQAPRFHVRDVAIKRGQLEGIPVLLGSATPSLESWVNCERAEHYQRTEITRRVLDLPMPEVHLVDMRDEYAVGGRFVRLSRLMDRGLAETLGRGEQAVVLMNRRGFASWIFCPRCKRRIECPNCTSSMVLHAARGVVLCHYCRLREPVPPRCPDPSCGSELVHVGSGTQRIEQHLQRRFAEKRPRYQEVIDDFEARRIDVLVGTQMIAKGLDFPHVSFVGVVNGDAAAAASDFRAGERLFQLITQVAGRAGRDRRRGQVVVQTMNPQSPALQAAIRHNFRAFVGPEMEIRRRLGYPPFTRLARVVLADSRQDKVCAEAESLADRVRQTIAVLDVPGTDLIGPQPCALARLRGLYRYDLLLRSPTPTHLQTLLDSLRADAVLKAKVKSVMIDVDPVELG
ncbi:MAG: replication restart helicase PriA [Planctomycetota bacterium]